MTRQSCEFQQRVPVLSAPVPPAARPRPVEARRHRGPITQNSRRSVSGTVSAMTPIGGVSPVRQAPSGTRRAGLRPDTIRALSPVTPSPGPSAPRLSHTRPAQPRPCDCLRGGSHTPRGRACARRRCARKRWWCTRAGTPGAGRASPTVFSPPVLRWHAAGFSVRGARGCTCRSLAGRGTLLRHASSEQFTSWSDGAQTKCAGGTPG